MKRYNRNAGRLEESDAMDTVELARALYDRVGARFPVTWRDRRRPEVDPADLPDGVSEADVEAALNDLRDRGYL